MTALRKLRLQAGLSLANAADRVGLAVSTLGSLERRADGPARLSFARAQRLADIYGCSLTDLLREPDCEPSLDTLRDLLDRRARVSGPT